MTIRSRLTIWYASVLLASILLMAGVMYYELVYERQAAAAEGLPKEAIEEEVAEVIFFYAIPTALATIVGGWWLLRKALAPLDRLTMAAERIHDDNLREPLPRTGNGDEVDRLSEVLNETTKRLDDSFTRIREFTLRASHELKTPLTVVRSELETALTEEALSVRERERTVNLLDEMERLTQIVDSLTFLTKADAGLLKLNKAPLALDDLLRDACEDAQALAQPQHVEVRLADCPHVGVVGDRRRLRQLILILADNAIKYNVPQGRVLLGLRVENSTIKLSVTNTGPGIEPSVIDRVFERFFRGDASHNSEVDGCGLGLTIARWIVQTHEGDIHIESKPNGLTTVEVCLPAAPEAAAAQRVPTVADALPDQNCRSGMVSGTTAQVAAALGKS